MIIGIDIGGTSIKFGVIDADFRVVYRESAATKTDGTDLDIVAQLKEVCLRLKAAYPVRCIGIGSPGTIDTARGEALLSPIRTELALPIPVYFTALGNDAGTIGAAITATELTA